MRMAQIKTNFIDKSEKAVKFQEKTNLFIVNLV